VVGAVVGSAVSGLFDVGAIVGDTDVGLLDVGEMEGLDVTGWVVTGL
jgi:hypothetical protein